MQTIYEPKGRAREYAELALNLYRGCTHGCTYCYSPRMLHMSKEEFHAHADPRLGVMATLERDAAKFKGKEIFLCFSCDPYPIDDDQMMTRQAIKVLHAAGCSVRILTKGGPRSMRDFDLLGPEDSYGTTLTFCNDRDSLIWEPNAALPKERYVALRSAKQMNIGTWVSLEPVIDPKQTLQIIRDTYPYVDMFKVGRWNYDARASKIDWVKFYWDVTDLLKSTGKRYYIKDSLRKCLD